MTLNLLPVIGEIVLYIKRNLVDTPDEVNLEAMITNWFA